MNTLRLLLLLGLASPLLAFEWPGGTMHVPVSFRGTEVFAGWVPSSPWGSVVFVLDPVVELRNAQSVVIAEYTLTGNGMDWYEGATRSGVATFTAPAGSYSITARQGRRLIKVPGEGYSGFALDFEAATLPGPVNRAPVIVWTSTLGTVASGQSYSVAAHAHDEDGNLSQVRMWKNGALFAEVTAGGADADASQSSADPGPQSITYTAQAFDAADAVSATISQTVTISAQPPAQYTLTTAASAGGSVSAGGTFTAGSTAYVSATPDATHDFVGWGGDGAGTANPLGVLMDRSKTVQANFSLKSFVLATSATSGGAVTPGGTYPYGTLLTLSGTPDATHRFLGWAGDASGTAPSITVLVDRALWVQAVFTDKTAQTISFAPLGNQPLGGVPLTLGATASSGLPVTYTLVSGPATLSGNQLSLTGPGAVTVQASQPGDGEFLPAPNVSRSFNAIAAAVIKYRPTGRTLLQANTTSGATTFVLENP